MSSVVQNKSPCNFSRNKQTFIPVSYRNHQSAASGRVDNTIPVKEKLIHRYAYLVTSTPLFFFLVALLRESRGMKKRDAYIHPLPHSPFVQKKKAHRTDVLPSITFVSLQFLFSLFILPQ